MKESSSGRKHRGRRVSVGVIAGRLSSGWDERPGQGRPLWHRTRGGASTQERVAVEGRPDGATVCPIAEDGCGQARTVLQS